MKAGIIGATGYVGVELVRLLLSHPKVSQVFCSSVSFENADLSEIYPALFSLAEIHLSDANDVIAKSDLIFTALPHGIAEQYAKTCIESGKKLIDLSADFRFDTDEKTFTQWYKESWKYPEIHAESVYGLPEINRRNVRKARVVGNPGCYVTGATLGLLPALKNKVINTDCIIVDSKSGVTGTGRTPTMTNHFCECGESFMPYAVGNHRHQPEIEHNVQKICGKPCSVVFTPHLLPINRGIICTIYAPISQKIQKDVEPNWRAQIIHEQYVETYKNEPFVRVLPLGKTAGTKTVRYSNYCDISVHVVHEGKMLQIISALDNMLKGAAGQAVQNMNIMCGFNERLGIDMIPPAF